MSDKHETTSRSSGVGLGLLGHVLGPLPHLLYVLKDGVGLVDLLLLEQLHAARVRCPLQKENHAKRGGSRTRRSLWARSWRSWMASGE